MSVHVVTLYFMVYRLSYMFILLFYLLMYLRVLNLLLLLFRLTEYCSPNAIRG